MYSALNAGAVHIAMPDLDRGLELAKIGGFEGLECSIELISDLVDAKGATAVEETFERSGIRPAGFGFPIEFRRAEFDLDDAQHRLRKYARAAKAVGFDRTGTYILPGDNERNADAMADFYLQRLQPLAEVLNDEGIKLALEFVGPKTMRDGFNYPFAYTLKGILTLAAAMGPGVGVLLDIFHLFTSGGTLEELRSVSRGRILMVHVNDARSGRTLLEQIDGQRELPGATGVLDLEGFIATLKEMRYEGPVIAEPFLDSLKELGSDEERAKAVGKSVADALALG